MGILITCDNKGCFENGEPLLNTNTNEVVCGHCGKVINSVTHFMKVQLKALGQTMKRKETNRAFAVQCQKCGRTVQPTIARDGSIMCSCGAVMTNLSPPMVQMLRTMLGSGGGNIDN